MNQPQAAGGGETTRDKGIRYLNSRIRPLPMVFAPLLLGILVQLLIEASNQKQTHKPTMFIAYFNLLLWFLLFAITYNLGPSPSSSHSSNGYTTIKVLLHVCVLGLVAVFFSISLILRMNMVATASTLAAAAVLVALRTWQCAATDLDTDVGTYTGHEEALQHLVELSIMATSMLLGAWFSTAFYYFQNYRKEVRDKRLLPSEYLTFFTSVAAALILVKSVPRRLLPSHQPAWEIALLICALYTGLAVMVLVIGASRYYYYALVPEAAAAAVWFVLWAKHTCWGPWQQDHQQHGGGHDGGQQGDPPPPDTVVLVAFAVIMALVSYKVKDFVGAMSTLYDEVFLTFITAAAVAGMGWRLLTQPPVQTRAPGVQTAARILASSAILLLLVSLVMFFGIMVRLVIK